MTTMAAQKTPDTPRMHLADLVRERRTELRLSLARLEERTVDPESGQTLPHSWVHRLEKGDVGVAPEVWRLRALAAGLKLPLARVQEAAAAQFFGVDSLWSNEGNLRALVEHAERLTPEQQQQLIRIAETFRPSAD
ncbi:XRE family transcriptional regulator [Streptomyces carpaticus]|uniref:XRE family transcriptional regulator n=1 Tax=Streptomyces carpaticus TaxID=285558 RepID=UPI0031F9EB74